MQKTTKTDLFTGVEIEMISLNDNTFVVNLPFEGLTTLDFNRETQCVEIPLRLFKHREVLNASEAALYLSVSKMRISRLCADGVLTSTKVAGRLIIDKESCTRYARRSRG